MPESPTETQITDYIAQTFAGTDVEPAGDDRFFIYDPDRSFQGAQRIPFATLVTRDEYETVSDLNRPGIFRLNIGVSKASYLAIFGAESPRPNANGLIENGLDYTVLDQLLPHPVYGHMHWICVLNPSAATFEKLKPLLAEAHQQAAHRAAIRG